MGSNWHTINQSISKGLACLVGRCTKILDDYCWISSPQLITKVLNLHKEKRGVYSPQAAGFAGLREEYSETQFFPPTFKGASTDTQSINQSPKDSLLLSAGYLKIRLIPTEFKSWIYARKKKQWIFSSSCRPWRNCGKNLCKPNFSQTSHNPQSGSNWHTINQSPKASLLLSAANFKSWVISIEFITTTIHKNLESIYARKTCESSPRAATSTNPIFPHPPKSSIMLQFTHNQISKRPRLPLSMIRVGDRPKLYWFRHRKCTHHPPTKLKLNPSNTRLALRGPGLCVSAGIFATSKKEFVTWRGCRNQSVGKACRLGHKSSRGMRNGLTLINLQIAYYKLHTNCCDVVDDGRWWVSFRCVACAPRSDRRVWGSSEGGSKRKEKTLNLTLHVSMTEVRLVL